MDAKRIIELRKQAEQAVAEMPDGELKVKAFEVILNHLLEGPRPSTADETQIGKSFSQKPKVTKGASKASSLSGRILVLRDENFFNSQKTIGELREELKAHGWHYPLTALSGTLQTLVQQRELRRERAKQGNKKIWKYSNR